MNRRIVLAARPAGMPRESDFRLLESAIPEPGPREVLVRALYVSVDPYMRGLIGGVYPHVRPVGIGETMFGGVVGRIVRSNDPAVAPGEIVEGYLGWQDYAVATAAELRRVDPGLAPISTALGVLGMPGMAAYFGLLEVGRPVVGETVVVSAGAGAVGSAAGQVAKIRGCRVVGIAGSQAKVDHVTRELGFDAAIDYRATINLAAAVQAACPARVDVFFDNVGGPIHDAVMLNLAEGARIVICGEISQYNLEQPDLGPRLLKQLEIYRARMEGFRVLDYQHRYPEGLAAMGRWLRGGRLKYREAVVEGLEKAPAAFLGLFHGENIGKQLVKVADA